LAENKGGLIHMSKLTVHMIQWRVVPGQVMENLAIAAEQITRAAPSPGDIVVLPEMFSSGFDYPRLAEHARASATVTGWMADKAREFKVALAGSLPETRPEGVGNSLVFMDEAGMMVGFYDKAQLFPVTGETQYFAAGDRLTILQWRGVKVGLLICFDLRFPELARALCLAGAELILVPAQWPLSRADNFQDLVKVRAMENQFFMVAVNSCGPDHAGTAMAGYSLAADPRGAVLASLEKDPGIASVVLDMSEVERVREAFPVLKWRRDDLPVES
jgi:predicted amidohydrolase